MKTGVGGGFETLALKMAEWGASWFCSTTLPQVVRQVGRFLRSCFRWCSFRDAVCAGWDHGLRHGRGGWGGALDPSGDWTQRVTRSRQNVARAKICAALIQQWSGTRVDRKASQDECFISFRPWMRHAILLLLWRALLAHRSAKPSVCQIGESVCSAFFRALSRRPLHSFCGFVIWSVS